MTKYLLGVLMIAALCSCDHSKWETVASQGISEEAQSIGEAIYFENEQTGVVGGSWLATSSPAGRYLLEIPVIYLTTDAGRNWRQLDLHANAKQSVRRAYLHADTLICELDKALLFSVNQGASFRTYTDAAQRATLGEKYLRDNETLTISKPFRQGGVDYFIEKYIQNKRASVIICRGPEEMTHYYFVSFDQGRNWRFLQKDFSSNRPCFLVADSLLYRYYFPLGLQKLKLKQ